MYQQNIRESLSLDTMTYKTLLFIVFGYEYTQYCSHHNR